MDMGTSIVNMSLKNYAEIITQRVDEITKLIEDLYIHRNTDEEKYIMKKITEKQQMLTELEETYSSIFKLKGE